MKSTVDRSVVAVASELFKMVGADGHAAGLERAAARSWSRSDWTRLFKLAADNGVTSYVHAELTAHPSLDEESKVALVQLRDRAHRCSLRNLGQRAELVRLVRAFDAEGIAVIPLKGPLLADRYYQRKALREFGDLDLLVSEGDRDRAWQLLLRLNYHSPFENHDLQNRYHVVFCHQDTGEVVELHWRIAGPQFSKYYRGDFLWSGARPVLYAGASVLQPTIEANLLYLAIHAYKHDWSRLQWLLDFPEVIAHAEGVNWDVLDRLAHEQHAHRLLRATLQIVRQFFPLVVGVPKGHPLAVPVMSQAQLRRVVRALISPGTDSENLGDFYALRVSLAETALDRLRLIGHSLRPSDRDHELLRLPASLRFLGFVVRPLRLAGRILMGRSRKAEQGQPP